MKTQQVRGQGGGRLPELRAVLPEFQAAHAVRNGLSVEGSAVGRRLLYLASISLLLLCSAQAEDPCAGEQRRALVLSGGGPKGAFQSGAIYHLVVHRKCDFHEFSGVSVGALNAAFLAQAAEANDATGSHAQLVEQSEALVSLWESIKGPKDVLKGRPLGTLRFGLFGSESLNDFQPLRHLLETNVSLDKLERGRPVSVGVTNFWDGAYREIAARRTLSRDGSASFLDYLYASSVPPVYGKMPRIRETGQAEDPGPEIQYGDGGLRHITPVARYFPMCRERATDSTPLPGGGLDQRVACEADGGPARAAQEPVQQLFVIVTSPYARDSDLLPVTDPKCCKRGRHEITKGPKILRRTLALMVDASYRWELDFLLFANDTLRWRAEAYRSLLDRTPAEQQQEAKRRFHGRTEFPLESYNRDPEDPDAPSLPYEIGFVIPEKEYAEVGNMLVFSRPLIREQLYCGCMAADKAMQKDFDLPSLAEKCAERFPALTEKKGGSTESAPASWPPMACQQAVSDSTR